MPSKQKKSKPSVAAVSLDGGMGIADHITKAFAAGETEVIMHAIGVAAKARGMSEISRQTGLSRENLYKALSAEGDPRFGTITRVLQALGLQLRVERAAAD